ncbi:MAG: HAD family hydrolase [Dehalococcoidia bacterium]
MTKVVLFDLGDTLFRLLPMADVAEDFARLMAGEGIEDAELEATRVLETFRERLMAGYGRGDLVEPAIAEVVLPFIGNDARARRLAGALDALLGEADIGRWEQAEQRDRVFDTIRSRGIRVGFVSNTLTSPELMRRRLEEFELLEHAEAAVFSVEHGIRKPNPEIYRAALRLMDAKPEDTLFVGDRVREDVRGPQSVGMRGVLTHEFRQEDPGDSSPLAVIAHLSEVIDLL